jgi:hypothetical protein
LVRIDDLNVATEDQLNNLPFAKGGRNIRPGFFRLAPHATGNQQQGYPSNLGTGEPPVYTLSVSEPLDDDVHAAILFKASIAGWK